jgi:hypothetical protein
VGLRQFEEAWDDLRRNQVFLFSYVALVATVIVSVRFGHLFLKAHTVEGQAPDWASIFTFGLDLYTVVAYSALISVFFALIGEEIDRPLWKYGGIGDALKRLFLPWLIINLLILTIFDLLEKAALAGNEEVVAMLTFVVLIFFLFAFPVGTCIMHHGRLEWGEMPVALVPIVHLFTQVLPVLFIGFLQFCLVAVVPYLGGELTLNSIGKYALFDAMNAVIDCLIFVMMWRVCVRHRNYEADNGGDYSDF